MNLIEKEANRRNIELNKPESKAKILYRKIKKEVVDYRAKAPEREKAKQLRLEKQIHKLRLQNKVSKLKEEKKRLVRQRFQRMGFK